jgi:hypothetical protein
MEGMEIQKKLAKDRLECVVALSLGIDRDTVWVGNLYENGICILNIKTGHWEKPRINLRRTNSIVVDNNVIWFAINGGIMRFFKNGVEDEVD